MKMRSIRPAQLCLAVSALWFLGADQPLKAQFVPIPQPNAAYTSSTSVLPITVADGTSVTSVTNGSQTVTFSVPLEAHTVPGGGWATWNSPPATESSTPRVLRTVGSNTVTLTLAKPATIFGFEVEPDSFSVRTITAVFKSYGTTIGTITLTLSGNQGALLAAGTDPSQPITSVEITETPVKGQSNDFAIAQIRSSNPFPESVGVFQLKYFTMQYGTGLINVTNAGTRGDGTDPSGTICANFYAFDPNEEMMACCACKVTPNGLASLDVKADIYNNMLINNPPSSITVKVLASDGNGVTCDAASGPTAFNLAQGLRLWGTTLHSIQPQGSPLPPALLGITETEFAKAELSAGELAKLKQYCRFIKILGSQVTGICKACRTGALGAAAQ